MGARPRGRHSSLVLPRLFPDFSATFRAGCRSMPERSERSQIAAARGRRIEPHRPGGRGGSRADLTPAHRLDGRSRGAASGQRVDPAAKTGTVRRLADRRGWDGWSA